MLLRAYKQGMLYFSEHTNGGCYASQGIQTGDALFCSEKNSIPRLFCSEKYSIPHVYVLRNIAISSSGTQSSKLLIKITTHPMYQSFNI
jgi:hypothetical protein